MMPVLHGLGLVEQFALAVQAMHAPDSLQNMLVPQPVPDSWAMPSVQVWAPVAHDVVPRLHAFGLVVQD